MNHFLERSTVPAIDSMHTCGCAVKRRGCRENGILGKTHQDTKSATTGCSAATSGLRVAARDMISSALRPSNGSLPLSSV